MHIVRLTAFAVSCALVVPAAALAAPAHDQTEKPLRTIAIEVNGETLQTDTPPQVVGGRVLVPLRDVFAALGIAIERNGGRIEARLPTGKVAITIDSGYAVVDGKRILLDSPVEERDGTVYAPLRLLAVAFGAQTNYDSRGSKVEIVSSYIGRQSGAEQARAGGGTDVQGVVAAIDNDSTPPSLTIVRGGTSRTISITSEAKVWTEDVTIHSQLKGQLTDVRVGDAIHAILAKDGRVISVFDFYKSTSGPIVAVSASSLVLDNGRVVTPSPITQILLNDQAVRLGDLKPGDYLTVRSNPESGELRELVASRAVVATAASPTPVPGTAPPATITSVALSVDHPLHSGDSFDVTMKGTAGARAAFDIGDYLTDQPMRETAPGFYVGRFTIPDRFNVTQVPVYGKLTLGTSAAPRTPATQTLSVATTPPAIGEVEPSSGQTINNARPSIFATYAAPTDIPINQSTVSISVNGHDVTSSATRTPTFVTYSPGIDLPSGMVTVVVKVSDAAGNSSTKTWTFTIQTR